MSDPFFPRDDAEFYKARCLALEAELECDDDRIKFLEEQIVKMRTDTTDEVKTLKEELATSLKTINKMSDEGLELMARLAKAQELVKQLYFLDEDEKNNIISALETAQSIGVFLDDLEESKVNVNRLWEIKQMLENLLEDSP